MRIHHKGPRAALRPLLLLLFFQACVPSLKAAISNGDDILKVNLTQQQLNAGDRDLQPLNLRLHPANDSSSPSSVMTSNTNIDLSLTQRLKDTLNIFDISYLASQWINVRSDISANCSQDIYKYLQGLQQAKMWAMKSK